MAKKLTNTVEVPRDGYEPLTKLNELPFIISFKYKLKKGYTFKELKQNHLKELQHFLDKISGMTISQVDGRYLRQPDSTDVYNGSQVQHYEVTPKFRIHGVLEDKRFEIIRLDPNHKKHKS